MKTASASSSSGCLALAALALLVTACTPGMFQYGVTSSSSSGGLQLYPSATTVGLNQSLTFQVYGGTPPYQYQLSGVGSIDSSGNYQSGSAPGQAQIQVSDSYSNAGSALVSVAQFASGTTSYGTGYDNSSYPTQYGTDGESYKMARARSTPDVVLARPGWTATTAMQLKKSPPVRGEVVAVEDKQLDSDGDVIHSRYIATNLRHPVVRMDVLVENKQVVGTRAVVEDQFIVALQSGYSRDDLAAAVAKAGAHISKQVEGDATYLVSMSGANTASAGARAPASASPTVSQEYFSRRTQLKKALQAIGTVSPNFVR